MAKSFKIQIAPTFKAPVEIPRVGGDPMRTTFTFKSFQRRELAKLFDKWKKQGVELIEDMRAAAEREEPWSLAYLTEREIQLQKEQLKDILDGWGFEDEFNDENIEALVETSVSVTEVIVEQYHAAYERAKKGN